VKSIVIIDRTTKFIVSSRAIIGKYG